MTEASSRPPSPDMLIPRPLCIRASSDQERDPGPRNIPDNSIIPSSVTRAEIESNLATLPRRDVENNAQQGSSIQRPWSRNTVLANQHHITQAVTPRESHPLTVSQTTTYDRTPSQLRMQQTTPTYVAACPAYQRKLIPQYANNVGIDPHPLPPLPVDSAVTLDLGCVPSKDRPPLGEEAKQSLQQPPASPQANHDDQSGWSPPIIDYSLKVLHTLPKAPRDAEVSIGDYVKPSRPRVSFQDVPPSPPRHAPRDNVLSKAHDTNPAQIHSTTSPTQLPSSVSLYTPRDLFPTINDDTRAHRRTQPKDAKFKYQFGRRPSLHINIPPSTPLHKTLIKPNLPIPIPQPNQILPNPSQTIPTSSSYTDGPRPPPWISLSTLQAQQQTRSDVRERLDARKYRMHLDSRSLVSKGSSSTESLNLRTEEMKREVEEYRMQVLRVYPDMEFDGRAGKGGREGCCACIVM
jgi:hypothetical protein